MILAVDFDGTCVEHRYPEMGADVPFAAEVQQKLVNYGHQLILYTMRSGYYLEQAIGWYDERRIPLFGVQTNPDQHLWTQSPKCYAHRYIDDAALGCPLIYPAGGGRPYVDWNAIDAIIFASEDK